MVRTSVTVLALNSGFVPPVTLIPLASGPALPTVTLSKVAVISCCRERDGLADGRAYMHQTKFAVLAVTTRFATTVSVTPVEISAGGDAPGKVWSSPTLSEKVWAWVPNVPVLKSAE